MYQPICHNIMKVCVASNDGLMLSHVLLDILWWTHWSCSYLLSYIGMLSRIGILFMVLLPSFC
jgi:hypothetical protein